MAQFRDRRGEGWRERKEAGLKPVFEPGRGVPGGDFLRVEAGWSGGWFAVTDEGRGGFGPRRRLIWAGRSRHVLSRRWWSIGRDGERWAGEAESTGCDTAVGAMRALTY